MTSLQHRPRPSALLAPITALTLLGACTHPPQPAPDNTTRRRAAQPQAPIPTSRRSAVSPRARPPARARIASTTTPTTTTPDTATPTTTTPTTTTPTTTTPATTTPTTTTPDTATPTTTTPDTTTPTTTTPDTATPSTVTPPAITAADAKQRYPWPRGRRGYEPLAARFPAPAGFRRVAAPRMSYAHWLRHLPLLPKSTPVRDYTGAPLPASTRAAAAVVDLDVGHRDLQQCVDTLLRLRGEYLWWRHRANRVRFRYAGGRYFGFLEWSRGVRPHRRGRRITFERRARPSYGRRSFRRYLTFLFAMTGTMHHVLEPRVRFADLAAGDFFLQPPPRPGYLGHAVVILDLARDTAGHLRALLGEGYTPAQSFHVLRAPGGGAWYRLDRAHSVQTPLWPIPFAWRQIHRFRY